MAEVKKFRIKPPYIAVICLFFMWLLDRLFPSLKIIRFPLSEFGIWFIAIGTTFLLWAFFHFKMNKTPILPGKKPTFMVIKGPYKFTRNPMYFSVTTILFGFAILIGNLLSFLGPLTFFLIINWKFIPHEEKLLEELFKKKYLEYKKGVRRWL